MEKSVIRYNTYEWLKAKMENCFRSRENALGVAGCVNLRNLIILKNLEKSKKKIKSDVWEFPAFLFEICRKLSDICGFFLKSCLGNFKDLIFFF